MDRENTTRRVTGAMQGEAFPAYDETRIGGKLVIEDGGEIACADTDSVRSSLGLGMHNGMELLYEIEVDGDDTDQIKKTGLNLQCLCIDTVSPAAGAAINLTFACKIRNADGANVDLKTQMTNGVYTAQKAGTGVCEKLAEGIWMSGANIAGGSSSIAFEHVPGGYINSVTLSCPSGKKFPDGYTVNIYGL